MSENQDQKIITCGVRWGNGAPSYAELLLTHGIAVLSQTSRTASLFDNIKLTDMVALKDGHKIIALSKFGTGIGTCTWKDVISQYISSNKTIQETLSKKYSFALDHVVSFVEVEEWRLMTPPIYYPSRQASVIIRQKDIVEECINRFNSYSEEDLSEEDKQQQQEEYAQQQEEYAQQRQEYEQQQQQEYEQQQQQHKKDIGKIKNRFSKKATILRFVNIFYLFCFLGVTGVYLYFLIDLYFNSDVLSISTTLDYLIKATLSITITTIVFWIAKFFNRRTHENVHLIEEYEHRSILWDTLELFQSTIDCEEHKKELRHKIVSALIENPTRWLSRNKADKVPTGIQTIMYPTSSLKPPNSEQ